MTCLKTMGFMSLAALTVTGSGPALAQSAAPAAAETLSLTPEEKADIVAHQTEASVDAARAGLAGSGDGRIHGEIGAIVGSHGTRDIYGTAAIPLGADAGATISFERSHYGPRD